MGALKEMIFGSKTRKARSGATRVMVVEEGGMLTAIVVDKVRGVVRIPIGAVDQSADFFR